MDSKQSLIDEIEHLEAELEYLLLQNTDINSPVYMNVHRQLQDAYKRLNTNGV